MRKACLILLLLTGCGHAGAMCVTRCGLQLVSVAIPDEPEAYAKGDKHWTCEEFQRVEDASLAAYAKYVKDPRFDNACKALIDWPVTVRSERVWNVDPFRPESRISGLTNCTRGTIEVGNVPPMKSAMAHEMAHAIQGCLGRGGDLSDLSHSHWEEDGIYPAERSVVTQGQQESQCLKDGITCWGGEP